MCEKRFIDLDEGQFVLVSSNDDVAIAVHSCLVVCPSCTSSIEQPKHEHEINGPLRSLARLGKQHIDELSDQYEWRNGSFERLMRLIATARELQGTAVAP